jgi:hypothetical protein
MFQVFTTIFFSASGALSFGVIAVMVTDNMADIRSALRLDGRVIDRMPQHRRRSEFRASAFRKQVTVVPLQQLAAA